jgi:hypothetical protein
MRASMTPTLVRGESENKKRQKTKSTFLPFAFSPTTYRKIGPANTYRMFIFLQK